MIRSGIIEAIDAFSDDDAMQRCRNGSKSSARVYSAKRIVLFCGVANRTCEHISSQVENVNFSVLLFARLKRAFDSHLVRSSLSNRAQDNWSSYCWPRHSGSRWSCSICMKCWLDLIERRSQHQYSLPPNIAEVCHHSPSALYGP